MKLLHELNESQGTTFIIVSHDPAVARQTNRIIVLADGKVARENIIGSPIEEALKMWRYSGLGRRLVNGDHDKALRDLKITEAEISTLRDFLVQAGG